MDMIKCRECNMENTAPANFCCHCGKPLSTSSQSPTDSENQAGSTIGDLNGDGKIDWEDFKIALSRSQKYTSNKIRDIGALAQQIMKSAKEKDAAAVEKLVKDFENNIPPEKTESQINREKFQAALLSTIDVKFAELMVSKKETEAYLTYIDAQILTAKIRGIFKNLLTVIPPQVEAACLLSETILSPSIKDKENKIKAAFGIAGGTAGIGIVISAIGSALGWGAGIVTSVVTAFAGSSFTGPIGWGVTGLSIAVIAGYFASTSNRQTDTERFLRVLKSSTERAVDALWAQYGEDLSKTVNTVKNSSQEN